MSVLPPFDRDGLLPAGEYELDFQRLRESFLVTGVGVESSTWDSQWREVLVNNLKEMTKQLWNVGVSGIRDANGHELEFPSAFRQSRRDGKPRGIIKLKQSNRYDSK
jgi:hypothetical protein